jgi:hypothetical protein
MKKFKTPILTLALISAVLFSCNKSEISTGDYAETEAISVDSSMVISDSISSVASLNVKDKQFIKTASVEMEVKDVYETTISVEKFLVTIGGFVTSSQLNSQILSEETYNTSDENAMLVRKFKTENRMQVRVPTEKLSEILQIINNEKLFLNARNISAEDVTANIALAKLEAKRAEKTGKNIEKLVTNKDKVVLTDENQAESNFQKVGTMEMTDQLKYSTVDIFINEPKLRIAEIAITNTKNIDNKYKFNFFYDVKNALTEGFYLIQKLIIGLFTIWPLILIFLAGLYFWKKRTKLKVGSAKSEE